MHSRERLRTGADFSRVTRFGSRTRTPLFTVYVLDPGAGEHPRIGLSVGRAVGKAVVRNRTRRRLREAMRPLIGRLGSCDVVVVARAAAVGQPTATLARSLEDVLAGGGHLRPLPSVRLGGTMGAHNPSPDVTEGTSS